MKKYYRRRIISSAMMAFIILLVLVIGGIYLFSLLQTEQNTDRMIQFLLSPEINEDRPPWDSDFPAFADYGPGQEMFPSAFYDIQTNESGQILSVAYRGFMDDADSDLQTYVDQILVRAESGGKLGSFKFGVKETETGGYHIILMNISIQMQTLYSVLRSALLIGGVLSIMLLIILFPVSSYAAELIIRNTEKQKQFITDAGHELKTPVAVIRSNLDVMELLDGTTKWSANIRGQVDRLENLVKQLLLLARLDEKQWGGKAERIDLSQIFESELNIYQETADQKNLKLQSEIQPGLQVVGDKEAMYQMIHAVMDNAMQYTPADGSVRVSCVREKKQLLIDITNTVDALPQIAPEKLTDRFTRGDTARSRKNGGIGIGLSTAKSVAEMVHGSIKINYLNDSMFQVVIHLPAAG